MKKWFWFWENEIVFVICCEIIQFKKKISQLFNFRFGGQFEPNLADLTQYSGRTDLTRSQPAEGGVKKGEG